MKIVHVCINNPFVEGMGYQENMLSRYQVQAGHEVSVVSINLIYDDKRWKYVPTGVNRHEGLSIIRIAHHRLTWGLVFPHGLYRILTKIQPDLIIHHNINCTSLPICQYYCKRNKRSKLVADNHADYINCNQNKWVQRLLYKMLIGGSQKLWGHYTKMYYGVSPMRCDFLKQMFHIPSRKIKFLPIGADIAFANTLADKSELRTKYNVDALSYNIVSGGKMGKGKGTDLLIKAVEKLRLQNTGYRLYLFGKFEDEETSRLAQSKTFVHIMGWCDRQKTLELLKMADMAVWAIHHTTLIEDAISVETPLVLRRTRTTEHLIDGNGLFMEEASIEALERAILTLTPQINDLVLKEASRKLKLSLDYTHISNEILSNV